MNRAEWTVVDSAIDKVLRTVRAASSNPAERGAALESLMAVVHSLDPGLERRDR